jgi:uncharacterized protein YrzB (UPF0473 family)
MDHEEILDNILVLIDEDGQELEFEVQAELEIEGETYRVLIPLDEDEEDEGDEGDEEEEVEVLILKVVYDEEGNEFMAEIEDEEEWEMVADAWDELLDSEEI